MRYAVLVLSAWFCSSFAHAAPSDRLARARVRHVFEKIWPAASSRDIATLTAAATARAEGEDEAAFPHIPLLSARVIADAISEELHAKASGSAPDPYRLAEVIDELAKAQQHMFEGTLDPKMDRIMSRLIVLTLQFGTTGAMATGAVAKVFDHAATHAPFYDALLNAGLIGSAATISYVTLTMIWENAPLMPGTRALGRRMNLRFSQKQYLNAVARRLREDPAWVRAFGVADPAFAFADLDLLLSQVWSEAALDEACEQRLTTAKLFTELAQLPARP